MKRVLLLIAVLVVLPAVAFAQGEKDYKGFSLELGTGIQPLHMTLVPTRQEKMALADRGMMDVNSSGLDCPSFSLSEVWRAAYYFEFCLTEGISWKIMNLIQYESFGIDPDGKPRYDVNYYASSPAGHKASKPVGSLTFQTRVIWTPDFKRAKVYSALGIGFSTVTEQFPLPLVTPLGLRFGDNHLYGFLEATLSPVASFGHGGIGWKF